MEPEILDQDAEYAAAFNEDDATGAGLGDDAPVVDEPAGESGIDAGDSGQAGGGAPSSPAVAVAIEAPAGEAAAGEEPAVDVEKERQRLKSWEGRLKAMQADIEAKGAKPAPDAEPATEKAADTLENVADAAAAKGSSELATAANAAAEAVEAGDISPDEAMAQLSEDFGDEFIKMIKAIVVATTKKEVAPVAKKVDDVESTMSNKELQAHFGAIGSKHADYQEIGQSEEFKGFIQGLPDDVRGDAEQVAKQGTAEEVIALLDAFKESKQAKAQPGPATADTPAAEEPAMEELEGVRSGGVRLPEKPAPAQDDFEGAWDQF